jgi:RimJ/RimL family protein N-acetyltransferase
MAPIPYPDPPLSDGVVGLRLHRPDDADAVVEFCDDPTILPWVPLPSPYTHADFESWQAVCRTAREEGRELALVVVDADDRPIGNLALKHLDRPGYAEIGYVMGAPSRGKGHMTRALRLARDHARHALGAERVELLIHHDNEASQRVARAAGFAETGEYRPCPTGCTPDQADHKVFAYPGAEEA